MGDNRKQRLAEAPTIADLQKAWGGVRKLELAGHNVEARALNKVLTAFGEMRQLTGAEPYPDNQPVG